MVCRDELKATSEFFEKFESTSHVDSAPYNDAKDFSDDGVYLFDIE